MLGGSNGNSNNIFSIRNNILEMGGSVNDKSYKGIPYIS